MKGVTKWSFRPYKPLMFDTGEIYICRLCPGVEKITLDWLPLDNTVEYTVFWRVRNSEMEYTSIEINGTSCTITGLAEETDYEFYVASGNKKSRVRLARTGYVPGDSVVNYLHPEDPVYSYSGRCLCSPSLVRHPEGYLLASMDVFQGDCPQNLTLLFRSDDEGKNWRYVSELYPCFWGKMFIHKGELYMLSVNTEYGDLLIGKSTDSGITFGMPTVLLRGSSGFKQPGVHKNPQPVLAHNGRLWCTLEWGSWYSGTHAAMCMSVEEDADLLDAENWHFTPPVPYDPTWEGTAKGKSYGCIEGCMVKAPDGKLRNIMRYQIHGCTPSFGKAIVMLPDENDPDKALTFDKVIDFPGNHSKFQITYDAVSGYYISIVSYLCEEHPDGRNWLAMIASKDLEHWTKVKDIFDYRDADPSVVGFQYINFMIEGEDILFLSRTAFGKPANYHDANYSVFTRLSGFREWLTAVK